MKNKIYASYSDVFISESCQSVLLLSSAWWWWKARDEDECSGEREREKEGALCEWGLARKNKRPLMGLSVKIGAGPHTCRWVNVDEVSAIQRVHSDGPRVKAPSVLRGLRENFPSPMRPCFELAHDGNLSRFETIRENTGFIVGIYLKCAT